MDLWIALQKDRNGGKLKTREKNVVNGKKKDYVVDSYKIK